ncbi:MAG: Flp family type IVb pilin [Geminicoccales bacterium]
MNARLRFRTWSAFQGNVRAFLNEASGAIGVEYGLIAALIALTIMGALKALGVNFATLPLTSIIDALS